MKIAIVLNDKAGQLDRAACEKRAQEILAACTERGIEATTHLCKGAHLTDKARELAGSGVDAVIAAGGDGTVSAIAAGLVDSKVALGVIPLGTLNHFSKDLGITDLDTALDAIAAGNTEQVDVGEVNGRVFVNNSSIGLYPEMVARRDADQRAHGRGKWHAMVRAAFRTLLRFRLLHIAIGLAGRVTTARTPFVFVGNNEYSRDIGTLGTRRRLDRGHLSIYTIRATRRLHMLWVMLRAVVRRDEPEDFETHAVASADIVSRKHVLSVALDGEVVSMKPPLQYRTRPGALRVIAPAPAAAPVAAT